MTYNFLLERIYQELDNQILSLGVESAVLNQAGEKHNVYARIQTELIFLKRNLESIVQSPDFKSELFVDYVFQTEASLVSKFVALQLVVKQKELNFSDKLFARIFNVSARKLRKWKSGDYNFTLLELKKIGKGLKKSF